MFGQRPWLPINLLFSTHWEHNLSCTIDKYIKMLYKDLQKSLKLAQDSEFQGALRQKHLYDHKVGVVELRPGDHVLVQLDTFCGRAGS